MFIAGLAAMPFTGFGQRYNFNTYTIANGLPNNQINDVRQDKAGRLWVATMNGACWFDGQNFNRFEQENPASNNPVKSIYEDKNGSIWLSVLRNGVAVFNGTQTKFYTIDDGLLSNNVSAVVQDHTGNYWIGTADGLSKFDGTRFISYTILKGVVNNEITCLTVDKKGNIWIGTRGGISKYDGRIFTNYTVKEGLSGNLIYSISEFKDGKIWIGTSDGISVFDGKKFSNPNISYGVTSSKVTGILEDYKNNKWFCTYGSGICQISEGQYNTLTTDEGLSDNNVQCISEDREGNLWLGTTKGLCRYSGGRFVTFTTDDGLSDNRILSVYNDNLNRTWFGIVNGGLNYFDQGRVHSPLAAASLNKSTIWCITQDAGNNYWFGTTNGPAMMNATMEELLFPFDLFRNKITYTILSNKNGSLWFGTDRGIYVYEHKTFRVINKLQGLDNDNIRALYQDDKGIVWIGTMQGLYFMNGNKAINFNSLMQIPKAPITSITQDNLHNIIFTTYDFGLYIFSKTKRTKAFTHIDNSSGLTNNRILFSVCDNNYVWLGTSQGIDRIDWNTYLKREFVNNTHFDKSNGYFGVESNSAVIDKSGFIWFATVNGAVRYNPNSGYSKTILPIIKMNSITAYMREVDWQGQGYAVDSTTGIPIKPMLKYGLNNLNFNFTGIYLAAPDEVKYRWKLNGFDDYWLPNTRLNTANYSNLPPGDYTFTVQATANNRDWSPPYEYAFQIKAPVWRTNFFYFMYAIVAVGAVLLLMKLRTRSLRKAQLALRQKINERTRELKEKNMELAKLSLVASETGNAVMIFDNSFTLEWVNEGFTRLTGLTKNELVKIKGNKLQQISFYDNIDNVLKDSIREKKSFVYEAMITDKHGEKFWTSSTLTPVFNERGDLKNIVIVDTDISLHKRMEEQIRESLEEKGSLLKEIHHRVKNNLQIIISLFNLQSSYIHDRSSHKILKEGQDRIRSMALIHERFYQSDGTSRIDFDDYMKRLCETIFQSNGVKQEKIKLVIEAEKISLDIDTAVPCGLIINELVSNSIKHAFNMAGGEIYVGFNRNSKNNYVLTVKDNGTGLPESIDFKNAETLGIQLVNALSEQIEGELTVENNNGFQVKIEFKPSQH